jgi:thioredoxin-related protein
MLRFLLAICLACATACAANDTGISPEVRHEVERRGQLVQYVGRGYQAGTDSLLCEAMAPPTDDSNKWFFSVISSRNCESCRKLKRDLRTSDEVKPWLDVNNHRDSHVHYHEFTIEDQSQDWRFAKVKFESFPTIIIQPPLSGRYGDPKNYLRPIVGYNGNSKELADTIRDRLREYLENLDGKQISRGIIRRNQTDNRPSPFVFPEEDDAEGEEEADVPFQKRTKVRTTKTEVQPMSDPILTLLMSLTSQVPGGLTGAAILGVGAFLLIRDYRKRQGKKLLVSDEQLTNIEKIVEQIIAKKLGVQSQTPSGS